ncbi:hypothetical protein OPQ81_008752 [Rhizoctonia solani]|nr:hypothetical protein OPQ81_008752 [Rhizoctonia solani]
MNYSPFSRDSEVRKDFYAPGSHGYFSNSVSGIFQCQFQSILPPVLLVHHFVQSRSVCVALTLVSTLIQLDFTPQESSSDRTLDEASIAEHVHDEQSQRILIDQLISNPHTIIYPPATDYQRKFWKNVVAILEGNGIEIEDKIYERLICTLNTPVRQGPPDASYLTYLLGRPESCTISTVTWCRPPGVDNFGQDYRPLTIRESRTTIERGTTGLRTWRASLDLSEWILQNHDIISSARVLELGSGVGLLGLLVATLQQLARPTDAKQTSCIYLTDVDDEVLARCKSNIRLPCNMLVDSSNVHIDAEVILAADVVYDPSIIPPLTRTLRLALERPLPVTQSSRDGANNIQALHHLQRRAYIALTLRREQTFAEFLASAEQEGLKVEFIEMDLPPQNKRVFRGSDDSTSGASATTQLMRLQVEER